MPYRATSGLHLAAQNGDVAALQRLLSQGAPVDLVSEIRYAAEDSDEEVEIQTVEWPPWMCTPLHAMCGAGDERFSNPADPQWQRNFRHEHMQCVKLLIAHGADPNAVDNWGRNTLKIAAESGLIPVLETLLKAGAVVHESGGHPVLRFGSWSMLHLTMMNLGPLGMRDKGLEIISLLCKAGAPADAEHAQYGTTLEYAVWVNHRRLWPFLFRLGVAYPRVSTTGIDARPTYYRHLLCAAPRASLLEEDRGGGRLEKVRARSSPFPAPFPVGDVYSQVPAPPSRNRAAHRPILGARRGLLNTQGH